MSDEPTTATILFTDVVDSTSLRIELGEERADRLRREHDALLTEAVERHRGRVVKGGGDGIMAAFASAGDALSAAVAGQQALHTYSRRSDAIAPLRVRMGLSIGDVSWEDGDCFGTPVVEAARLEAVADGGQILCTDFVRAMARGRGGHAFEDLGLLELKGLPDPVAVCAVVWEPVHGSDQPQLPLPAPLRAAADDPMFVGRERHITEIESFLDGRGIRLVWLLGEPGAGKTRLAAEIARRTHDRGGQVLYGRCDVDIRTPYRPFVEAMLQVAHGLADDEGSSFAPYASELVRLLPELERFGAVPAPEITDADVGRWRLLEAIRGWLADLAETGRLLLVVDDLHWAGESTLLTLRHLIQNSDPPEMAVVVTARDTESGAETVQTLLAELVGDPTSLEVSVGGLQSDDVAELLTDHGPPFEDGAVGRFLERTAGNALFLRTLLTAGDPEISGGRDVQAVVRRRLSRLPDDVVETMRVGAVVGLDLDARVVAAVRNASLDVVVTAFDAALHAGLVEAAGGTSYRFVHALVREALRGELSTAAEALVHLRIAEALDRHVGVAASAAVRAHHWREALPAGAEPHTVVAALEEAAGEAELQHDWERSSHLLQSAVEVLGGLESTWGRALGLRAGIALRRQAEAVGAMEILGPLAQCAWAAADDDMAARAAIEYSRARSYATLLSGDAFTLTQRARERPPSDPALAALLDGYHALNLTWLERWDEARRLWLDAIATARRLDDRSTFSRLVSYSMHFALVPSRLAGYQEMLAQGHEIAAGEDDLVEAGEILIGLTAAAIAKGCHEDVRPAIDATLADPEFRASPAHYHLLGIAATLETVRGRFAAAEELVERSRTLSVPDMDQAGVYGIQMFSIRREQGLLGRLLPMMRRVMAGGGSMWRTGVAAIAAAAGDVDQCQQQLDHALRSSALDLPSDASRTGSIAVLAEAAAVAGDIRSAETLHRELRPESGFHIVMFPVSFGPVDRVLGVLSRTAGRLDDSVTELERAVEQSVSARSPVYEARARVDLAVSLAQRDRGEDRARARAEARAGRETAARLGMAEVADRAEGLLGAAG